MKPDYHQLSVTPSEVELHRSYEQRQRIHGQRRTCCSFQNKSKTRWIIIGSLGLLTLIGGIICVIILGVLPNLKGNKSLDIPNLSKLNSNGLVDPPDLDKVPEIFKSLDDEARPNSLFPKLKEKFEYGKMKIRGVNLGGWLVPEPFIVPSIYEDHINEGVVDEWTLCETIGKKKCTQRLLKHYDTFLTEDHVKQIQEAGLNHVRIPIGYWMIENLDDEPFVYGSWDYLLRGIGWCKKYGLRVMLDFHAAPGSQNGWNHSGKMGEVHFLNSTSKLSEDNVTRFLKILERVATYFSQPEFKNVITQIGILNEPALQLTHDQLLTTDFYKTSFQTLRKDYQAKSNLSSPPLLVYHDGFLGLKRWKNTLPPIEFPRIAFDVHNYVCFNTDLLKLPKSKVYELPCTSWLTEFKDTQKDLGYSLCGEFSVATNDCGKWLNGINLGSRYDGTYILKEPVCSNCTCEHKDDVTKFSSQYKMELKRFVENQMDAFETGLGWYFWNFKTENGVNPHWDYLLGWKEGWMPKDANNREYGCFK